MKLFKTTSWKFWELKVVGIYTLAVGGFVASYIPETMLTIRWYLLGVAVVAGVYTIYRYFKQ